MIPKKKVLQYSLLTDSKDEARVIPDDFLSLTIDSSLFLGGHWWGDTKKIKNGVAVDRVKALDLKDKKLLSLAKALAPAMVRIGGTEADRVKYKVGWKALKKLFGIKKTKKKGPRRKQVKHALVLNKKFWNSLIDFFEHTGLDLLFNVSAGPADRDATGSWLPDNTMKLIAYTLKQKFHVPAWELGNEVNGFLFLHGLRHHVSASQYARDFIRFAETINSLSPGSKIVGPASAVWPKLGEINPIINTLCASPSGLHLDALSWHYYPQQSSNGPLAVRRAGKHTLLCPDVLNGVARLNKKIEKSRRKIAESEKIETVENWITETGHALYGGEQGLSDSFVSTLWWLDQLGLMAREGVNKIFRQSLVGARYGMLDQETFDPRPDYYASFLWKKLMGNRVKHVELNGKNRKVRAYLHSGRKEFFPKSPDTLLLININKNSCAEISLSPLCSSGNRTDGKRQFTPDFSILMQGKEGFVSKGITINGTPAEEDLVFLWKSKQTQKKYKIGKFSEAVRDDRIIIPPLSVIFCIGSLPDLPDTNEAD